MNASASIATPTSLETAPDVNAASSAPRDGAATDSPGSAAPNARYADEAVAQQDQEARAICSKVEALVVSSSRALPAVRIAQALGLMPPDEEEAAPPALPAADGTGDALPVAIVKPGRRRRAPAKGGPSPLDTVKRAVELLNADYERSARSFRIEPVAGGYRVMTLPTFAPVIAALSGVASRSRLSQEALVTLAIIAYRQPVKRVDIEAIRGVACGEVLKSLLERRLVTIAGRAEELGRPMLYATTPDFLRAFGLSSIKDLPSPQELGLRAQ